MRDLTNRQVRLRRRPAGLPSPEDFELTEEPAPVPGAGQVLVRTLLLSIDPAMRVLDRQNEGKSIVHVAEFEPA
jgi:NADPH-dependent curcumin reductase